MPSQPFSFGSSLLMTHPALHRSLTNQMSSNLTSIWLYKHVIKLPIGYIIESDRKLNVKIIDKSGNKLVRSQCNNTHTHTHTHSSLWAVCYTLHCVLDHVLSCCLYQICFH